MLWQAEYGREARNGGWLSRAQFCRLSTGVRGEWWSVKWGVVGQAEQGVRQGTVAGHMGCGWAG